MRPPLHVVGRADLLSVHDLDGRVWLLSPGWTQILGADTAGALVGGDLLDVVNPADRQVGRLARRLAVTQERHVVVEIRVMTPDGEVPVEAVVRPPLTGQRAYVTVYRRLGADR